jgi:DNA-binding transcriptional ArsR family regulator
MDMREQTLTDVLHALSDPTRRGIVGLLRSGPRTAGDLAQAFPLAKSTLSAHFTVLRYAGLVSAERHGRSIVYHLDHGALEDVVATLNGWLDGGGGAPMPATQAIQSTHAAQAAQAARTHPPRHAEPERTRRRTAARALAVEGGLALLLTRLAMAAPGESGQPQAVGPQPQTEPPASARGAPLSRRRGLGHLIRFGA